MVKKIKLLAAAFSLSLLGLQAQTPYYYYYKGEKQHLSLHTEYAFYTEFTNQTKNIFPFISKINCIFVK